MKNILATKVGHAEMRAILAENLKQPLLAPFNSALWQTQAKNAALAASFAPLVQFARQECAEPMPELSDALYADFSETGNRIRFETPYFERRRRFGRVSAALLLNPDDRVGLQESYLGKLAAIFNEESWALPAHVADPSGKDPMTIDLFAGETANMLAESLDLFGLIIPQDLAEAIRSRLRRTIFQNYIDNHSRMFWTTFGNNWNAVCHQGVLGAALAVENDPDILARMLSIASDGLPHFLRDFGIDGGTSEGPRYWEYGFGWFARLNQQLELATQDELSLFADDPHIDQISMFGIRMALSNDYSVNFADALAKGDINPQLLGYLGKRLDNKELCRSAQVGYRKLTKQGLDYRFLRADLPYFARLINDWPSSLSDAEPAPAGDFYFHDLDVIVARRQDAQGHLWEFAAKGGHNAESHNHNDGGSYLLNVDGCRVAAEIGMPEYCKKFFSPSRYEDLAARSLGHSVPLVNGVEQAEGRNFAAEVRSHEIFPECVKFSVDLTACYPAAAKLARLWRSLTYEECGSLSIHDMYEMDGGTTLIETAIITDGSVARDGQDAVIVSDSVKMRVAPSFGTSISSIDEHGYSDHDGKPAAVRRIVLKATKPAQSGVLGYTLKMD